MKRLVTIREYAQLTTKPIEPSLDRAQVSPTAFDWLCELSASFNKSGATLLQVEGRRSLKWDNYVGVLDTPCGTRIEILPKHSNSKDAVQKSRTLLQNMIQSALDVKNREIEISSLELFDAPITEWVIGRFLDALDRLTKRGIRFDYLRIEEEQSFLRGQLNIPRQMRQPPGRQHHFQIRHDVFSPDRPENRLLKRALDTASRATKNADNWRLANELRSLLLEIPTSADVEADFRAWRSDRLMEHYLPIKPWCELILRQKTPLSVMGHWEGLSLLFPMEKLFERYVEGWLRRSLNQEAKLVAQASAEFLCHHNHDRIFQLKPDLLVSCGSQRWVLDAKWKLVDTSNRKNNYGLSQPDFYQLFAYGQKYLKGQGDMMLIYPQWEKFVMPLPIFDFGGGLKLRALPFDLENAHLVGVAETSLPLQNLAACLES